MAIFSGVAVRIAAGTRSDAGAAVKIAIAGTTIGVFRTTCAAGRNTITADTAKTDAAATHRVVVTLLSVRRAGRRAHIPHAGRAATIRVFGATARIRKTIPANITVETN